MPNGVPVVTGSSDKDANTTRQETLSTPTDPLPTQVREGILVLERRTWRGNFVQDVKVDICKVAAVLPLVASLALEMKKRGLLSRDGCAAWDLHVDELRRWASASRIGRAATGSGLRGQGLTKRQDNVFVESLDTALLLVSNLGLGPDHSLKLDDVVLDLLDINWSRNLLTIGHLLDVGLQLGNVLAVNLRVLGVALFGDLGVKRSRECNWE
jgi:hypothetical protein